MNPHRVAGTRTSLLGILALVGAGLFGLGNSAAATPPHLSKESNEFRWWSPGAFPCECLGPEWEDYGTNSDCNVGFDEVVAVVNGALECFNCVSIDCINGSDPCPCSGLGQDASTPPQCGLDEIEVPTVFWGNWEWVFCVKCVPVSCFRGSTTSMVLDVDDNPSWGRIKATYR